MVRWSAGGPCRVMAEIGERRGVRFVNLDRADWIDVQPSAKGLVMTARYGERAFKAVVDGDTLAAMVERFGLLSELPAWLFHESPDDPDADLAAMEQAGLTVKDGEGV